MLHEIYILDLIGTFAFASYGSYLAVKKNFDIFGIFVCAFLTAVGGGTMREILLGNIPFYFFDKNYFFAIVAATVFSVLLYKNFHKINKFVLALDAIGLVTFAFIGATKANELHLGMFAIVSIATTSAVGGGVLRDIVLNKMPEIMYRDFYASVAILLGVIYGITHESMQNIIYANLLILFCLCLRLIAIYFKVNLWKPWKK